MMKMWLSAVVVLAVVIGLGPARQEARAAHPAGALAAAPTTLVIRFTDANKTVLAESGVRLSALAAMDIVDAARQHFDGPGQPECAKSAIKARLEISVGSRVVYSKAVGVSQDLVTSHALSIMMTSQLPLMAAYTELKLANPTANARVVSMIQATDACGTKFVECLDAGLPYGNCCVKYCLCRNQGNAVAQMFCGWGCSGS